MLVQCLNETLCFVPSLLPADSLAELPFHFYNLQSRKMKGSDIPSI
jgi:hypothetical protein